MTSRLILRASIALVALAATVYGAGGIVLVAIITDGIVFAAWEIVLIALLFDLTWTPSISFHSLPWYTLLSIALLWSSEPIRRELLA